MNQDLPRPSSATTPFAHGASFPRDTAPCRAATSGDPLPWFRSCGPGSQRSAWSLGASTQSSVTGIRAIFASAICSQAASSEPSRSIPRQASLDDRDLEALPSAVDRRVRHAEVGRQTGEEQARDAPASQVPGEAGGGCCGRSRRTRSRNRWRAGSPCAAPGPRRRYQGPGETPPRGCPARSGRATAPARRRGGRWSRTAPSPRGSKQTRGGRADASPGSGRGRGKRGAIALITATTASPSGTSSAPPGQKSFWTSTTTSAASSRVMGPSSFGHSPAPQPRQRPRSCGRPAVAAGNCRVQEREAERKGLSVNLDPHARASTP